MTPEQNPGTGSEPEYPRTVLVQILLPDAADGESLNEQFRQTRVELVDKFHGITVYQRAPARGAWRNPEGEVERDDVVMVEVIAGEFDKPWWRQYRQLLAERFEQREVHIRALSIDVP